MRRAAPSRLVLGLLALAAAANGEARAQHRLAVHPEPGTPVVATEVLIATGPADEPEGQEGIAHLTARAVTRPIRAGLDSLEAHLEITTSKDAVGLRLIAAPDAWPEAVRLLMVALFRDPVNREALEAERRELEAELLGRRENPADAAIRAADAALFGEEHPWGRPAVGQPATIRTLSHDQVDAFLRASFRPERAVAAVVGPIAPEDADRRLSVYLDGPGEESRFEPPAEREKPDSSTIRTDYNSVTTWVTVIFPVRPGADAEALRFLAHLVGEQLSFGPTRQSVYDSRAELIRRIDGGELRLTVVVPPDEAEHWADRATDLVAGLGGDPYLQEGWEGRLRRYRGERLHHLSAPEDRAAELARTLFVAGSAGDPLPRIEDLTVGRVREAVEMLGEPIIVLLGPRMDEQD